MIEYNIPIKPHSNKPVIVVVLKQQCILPENYVNGLRRCSPPIAPTRKVSTPSVTVAGIPKRLAVQTPKRLAAQTVELTDMDDGSVTIYPSLYKAAKFLGTYNNNISKHNGMSYSTCDAACGANGVSNGVNKIYKIRVNPLG